MRLEVKNLVFAPVGEKESFNIELFNEKIDEDTIAERIRGNLKLTRLEEQILAQFEGTSRVKVVCDRCLVDFCLDVLVRVSQEYFLDRAAAQEGQLVVSSHFDIDILDPLKQEIMASLPVKKLCKVDCSGICASCGKNLNVEKCVCKSESKSQNDKSK